MSTLLRINHKEDASVVSEAIARHDAVTSKDRNDPSSSLYTEHDFSELTIPTCLEILRLFIT